MFPLDFGRISMLTCFDINFPELWHEAYLLRVMSLSFRYPNLHLILSIFLTDSFPSVGTRWAQSSSCGHRSDAT